MNTFKFFLRYGLAWIGTFGILRLFGLLYFWSSLHSSSDRNWMFIQALRLDLATTSYFIVGALLLFFLNLFLESYNYYDWIKKFTFFLLIVCGIIYFAELGIITSWTVKINYRAVTYLFFPQEAIASMSNLPLWLYFLLFFFYLYLTWEYWKVLVFNTCFQPESMYFTGFWKRLLALLFSLAMCVIPLRGGIQKIPINESDAAYSNNQLVNFLTTNSVWYLAHNILLNLGRNQKNPYQYFDPVKAHLLWFDLFKYRKNPPLRILNKIRPNIVFIQMESLTANLFECLGKDQGVMPFLDSLARKGVLFENIYSPGLRTDQGLTSLQSAFPAQPTTSIIKHSEKHSLLPSLARTLKNEGYFTSIYYGGEMNFGNFKTYAVSSGFQQIYDQSHFKGLRSSSWGVDDEHVLLQQAEDLNQVKQPFYSYLLTLTSHEPFRIPIEPIYQPIGVAELFCNAAHYTDFALKTYFDSIKTMPWYKNTLFILASDHGHSLPQGLHNNDPNRYHIPLIMFGEPIKYNFRGKRFKNLGSQVDIASTLLKQLKIDDTEYEWSNDLLNPRRKNFAYFSFEDGMGWMIPSGFYVQDNKTQKWLNHSVKKPNEGVVDQSKAYLQVLFEHFSRK